MKKGQVAGQIFIYVIAVVVVGLILVYGYSAIKNFTKRGEEVEYIALKTDIENSFKSIISDYGSVKRPDIAIPGKFTHICFVDKSVGEDSIAASPICTKLVEYEEIYNPVVCSAWKNRRDNGFLIPEGTESFDVGEITIVSAEGVERQPYICVENINGKAKLQLKGLGDKVLVTEYE